MITPPRIPQLPAVTHVQFFVLESLMACPLPGKELRSELRANGWLRSKRNYDQITNTLEETGLVRGWNAHANVGDAADGEGHYEITVAGMRAYHAALAFYCNRAPQLVR